MKRTTEFVLGLIGGILGVFASFMGMFVGTIDASIHGQSGMMGLGDWALILSLIGIVGSVTVKFKPVTGGVFMVVAAIGGFICVYMAYTLPGILLLLGGILGIFKREKNVDLEA
jgi:hypothetical protein